MLLYATYANLYIDSNVTNTDKGICFKLYWCQLSKSNTGQHGLRTANTLTCALLNRAGNEHRCPNTNKRSQTRVFLNHKHCSLPGQRMATCIQLLGYWFGLDVVFCDVYWCCWLSQLFWWCLRDFLIVEWFRLISTYIYIYIYIHLFLWFLGPPLSFCDLVAICLIC